MSARECRPGLRVTDICRACMHARVALSRRCAMQRCGEPGLNPKLVRGRRERRAPQRGESNTERGSERRHACSCKAQGIAHPVGARTRPSRTGLGEHAAPAPRSAFLRLDGLTAPLSGQPPPAPHPHSLRLSTMGTPPACLMHPVRGPRLPDSNAACTPTSASPPFRSRGTAAEGGPRHTMALPRGHAVRLVVCAGLAALLAPARAKLYHRVPNGMDTRGSGNPKDWDARAVTSLYAVFYEADFNADIGQFVRGLAQLDGRVPVLAVCSNRVRAALAACGVCAAVTWRADAGPWRLDGYGLTQAAGDRQPDQHALPSRLSQTIGRCRW